MDLLPKEFCTVLRLADTAGSEQLRTLLVSAPLPPETQLGDEVAALPAGAAQAWQAIQEGKEESVPASVFQTAIALLQHGLDLYVSRKPPTKTCATAAEWRLNIDGKFGIETHQDMKALAYKVSRPSTFKGRLVLVALSASCEVDMRALSSHFSSQWEGKSVKFSPLSPEDLADFNAYKGAVNPASMVLNFALQHKFKHMHIVFDKAMVDSQKLMYTNMGCNTWSMAFDVLSFFEAVQSFHADACATRVATFTEIDSQKSSSHSWNDHSDAGSHLSRATTAVTLDLDTELEKLEAGSSDAKREVVTCDP